MGIYYCEVCGAQMCGETFDCEKCGRGSDGDHLCEECAIVCCASTEAKEHSHIQRDVSLLRHTLKGVYLDNHDRAPSKEIMSESVREILKLTL